MLLSAYTVYSCNGSSIADASVDIRIQRSSANIDRHSLSVYKRQGLSTSTDCTVIENTANFSLSLTWKFNSNNVQTFSSGQQPAIYQVNENNMQRLYITKNADSDDGVYSCYASVGSANVLFRSFTLNFKGTVLILYLNIAQSLRFAFAVDCVWSAWSACSGSCGAGRQIRREAVPKQYGGKACAGSSVQVCDTRQPPCKTII